MLQAVRAKIIISATWRACTNVEALCRIPTEVTLPPKCKNIEQYMQIAVHFNETVFATLHGRVILSFRKLLEMSIECSIILLQCLTHYIICNCQFFYSCHGLIRASKLRIRLLN